MLSDFKSSAFALVVTCLRKKANFYWK